MLNEWLEYSERKSKFAFSVIDLKEKQYVGIEKIAEVFESIVIDNTVGLDTAKKIAETIGWENTVKNIIVPRIPTNPNMKKGKFGEMIETSFMEESLDCIIPIKKWRGGITSNQSLPGTDIIAIRVKDEKITEIIFVECKVTGTNNNRIIVEAYAQLMKDKDKGFAESLSFVTTQMYDNNDPLAEKFIEYCLIKNRPNDSYRISAVYDKNNWDEKSLENLASMVTGSDSNLTVDVITIKTLEETISKIYEKRGWRRIE